MKTCSQCHTTKALTEYYRHKSRPDGLQPVCKDCGRVNMSKWRKANPVREKELQKASYDRNQEQRMLDKRRERAERGDEINQRRRETYPARQAQQLVKNKEYYQAHRTEMLAKASQYQREHPEVSVITQHKRRAAKLAGGTFTHGEWVSLCNQYGNRCLKCGEAKPLSVDHVMPLSKGGANTIDNIQPLCRDCNSQKSARAIDYRVTA